MPRRARTLMTVVSARDVLVLTCCGLPSLPAGGGGASRVRLGRPRGRPSCPPAVGCEPRPPMGLPRRAGASAGRVSLPDSSGLAG